MSQPPYDPPPPPDPYAPPSPGATAYQGPATQQYPAPPPAAYQGPVQQYGAPAAPAYGAPPGYGAPAYGTPYPEASQATLALVLGIVGVVVVQLAAPFAWWLGAKERAAIDAGRRDPVNRGQAVAGWVLGIIGTILLGIGLLFLIGYVIFLVFFVAAIGTGGALSS